MEELDIRIVKYLARELPPEEVEKLEAELETNPELAAELRLAITAEIAIQQGVQDELEASLIKRYQELKQQKKLADPGRVRALWTTGLVAVAAAIVVILFLFRGPSTSPEIIIPQLYAQYYEPGEFEESKSINTQDSLWLEAITFLKNGQHDEGIQQLKILVSDSSFTHLSKAYLYMGHALMELEAFDQAIGAYKKVTDDRQTSDWYIGLAYLGKGDAANAIDQFRKVKNYRFYREQAESILELLTQQNQTP